MKKSLITLVCLILISSMTCANTLAAPPSNGSRDSDIEEGYDLWNEDTSLLPGGSGSNPESINAPAGNQKYEIQFRSAQEAKERKIAKSKKRGKQVVGVGLVAAAVALGTMTGVGLAIEGGALLSYGGYKLYKRFRKHHIVLTSEDRKFISEEAEKNHDNPKEVVTLVTEVILDQLCIGNGYPGGSFSTPMKDKKATPFNFLKKDKYLKAYDEKGASKRFPYFSGYPHIVVSKRVICSDDRSLSNSKQQQHERLKTHHPYLQHLFSHIEHEGNEDEAELRREFDRLSIEIRRHGLPSATLE